MKTVHGIGKNIWDGAGRLFLGKSNPLDIQGSKRMTLLFSPSGLIHVRGAEDCHQI